jgi:protein-tyrosine phosphatase
MLMLLVEFFAYLTLDADNNYTLPENFRTTAHMKNLKLIGSAQFSEDNLKYIMDHYPKPDYLFDLRQESHGFIDGIAISHRHGETNRVIVLIGNIWLNILKQGSNEINEQHIANKYKIKYTQIPVLDHQRPSDEEVNYFVKMISQIPVNKWLYFHCRDGKGRTTTFMAMTEMMRDRKASFEYIMHYQHEIGGDNLLKLDLAKKLNSYALARVQFLKNFYDYCKENRDNFQTSWSEWLKKHELRSRSEKSIDTMR